MIDVVNVVAEHLARSEQQLSVNYFSARVEPFYHVVNYDPCVNLVKFDPFRESSKPAWAAEDLIHSVDPGAGKYV